MPPVLSAEQRARVLEVAAAAIHDALAHATLVPPEPADLGGARARVGASFVTLERDGELLGCVGALHHTLEPGRDGVAIELGARRATFLPAVWRQLPDPVSFCRQLWRKGGFEPGAWPVGLRLARYPALEVTDPGPRRTIAPFRHTRATP